jgi:betaine-aldehyde dehydrogenase
MATEVKAADELYIGGEWTPSAGQETIDVISPATGRPVVTLPLPTAADADRAVSVAREAFDTGPWPRLTMVERAEYVQRFRDSFAARSEEFSEAWMTESGPTIGHCRLLHGAVPILFDDLVARAQSFETREPRDLPDGPIELVSEPVGVALTIMTWNGPALYLAMKVMPALLAGCTVIVKMAAESQLTARLVGELADEAGFPPGVVSVLAAATDVSEHLAAHPGVDKVSLTGSIPAGRAVMAACAPRIAKLTLELGGKSAAILADDVDVEEVLDSFVPGFIAYSGQVCIALTRLLVPRGRRDEIVASLVRRLSAMRVGDPALESSDLGPLGSRRQLERVEEYVASGIAEGARVVLGGTRPDGLHEGFYYEPTVFVDVTPDMRIAREEIFGPVLCVIAYDDIEEAIRIANGTDYGLNASVYAKDARLARSVADRVQAGAVAVNTAGISFFAPFGGIKQSGVGRELGNEGIAEFLQLKTIKLG